MSLNDAVSSCGNESNTFSTVEERRENLWTRDNRVRRAVKGPEWHCLAKGQRRTSHRDLTHTSHIPQLTSPSGDLCPAILPSSQIQDPTCTTTLLCLFLSFSSKADTLYLVFASCRCERSERMERSCRNHSTLSVDRGDEAFLLSSHNSFPAFQAYFSA